jgi:hypothetical protein
MDVVVLQALAAIVTILANYKKATQLLRSLLKQIYHGHEFLKTTSNQLQPFPFSYIKKSF